MCLWALYHVLTWKWSNTLSILQWLNIFVLFGRFQCQIFRYLSTDFPRTPHKVLKGARPFCQFDDIENLLSVRTFRILFPGEISLDAFLSRIPLETAMCPNNRHVSSRRSHERTRAASWLVISWLSYLKGFRHTALWLGRAHISHFLHWNVSEIESTYRYIEGMTLNQYQVWFRR